MTQIPITRTGFDTPGERLFEAGRTGQDISRQAGRTPIAIRTRLYKLGLKTKSQSRDAIAGQADFGADFGMVSHQPA